MHTSKYQGGKDLHLVSRLGCCCILIFILLGHAIFHFNPHKVWLLVEFNGKQLQEMTPPCVNSCVPLRSSLYLGIFPANPCPVSCPMAHLNAAMCPCVSHTRSYMSHMCPQLPSVAFLSYWMRLNTTTIRS